MIYFPLLINPICNYFWQGGQLAPFEGSHRAPFRGSACRHLTDLLGSNQKIQINNQGLYEQNKVLTLKIENYQEELEEKSKIIKELEKAEGIRSKSEQDLVILKKTKPQVDASLFIKDDYLMIKIEILKRIPFRFRPFISSVEDKYGLTTTIYTSWPEVHPKEGIQYYYFKYAKLKDLKSVSYTHLTLPTICSV